MTENHQPDFPFGCTETWGPVIMHDWRVHVCNLDTGHPGAHECKCGDQQ